MSLDELVAPFVGGIAGFVLAELVSLSKLIWAWRVQPQLVIEDSGSDNVILRHSVPSREDRLKRETIYGFSVKNVGRTIAKGVRCQLVEIQVQQRGGTQFSPIVYGATALPIHTASQPRRYDEPATLVPGASITYQLAFTDDEMDYIAPSVRETYDYYEEACHQAVRYRFKIIALDDRPKHCSADLTVEI